MKAWKLVVVLAVVVGLAFGVGALRKKVKEHNVLKARAQSDAEFLSDTVIARAVSPYSVEDTLYGKGRVYEYCWSSPAQDYLYKATLRAGEDGRKLMTLVAYELPHGDDTCRCHALEVLVETLLGRLEALKEERFTDDDANGTLEGYCRYARADGKVFVTPRDRDIGERAGVSVYRSSGDEWPRYMDVLKQARGYLEKKSEKK